MHDNDSLKDQAYAIIKNKIVTCELMPGTVVDQNALMDEIGVSKTPIREAIYMLEKEGLLTIMSRRAVAVTHVSLGDIDQMYTVRALVEPFVARLACRSARTEELEEYYRVFSSESFDRETIIKSDFGLHKHLVERTENKYLIRMMDGVLCQNMRFVILGASQEDRMRIGNREHMEIIEKVLSHDEDGAEAAMRTHIGSAKKVAYMVNNIQI